MGQSVMWKDWFAILKVKVTGGCGWVRGKLLCKVANVQSALYRWLACWMVLALHFRGEHREERGLERSHHATQFQEAGSRWPSAAGGGWGHLQVHIWCPPGRLLPFTQQWGQCVYQVFGGGGWRDGGSMKFLWKFFFCVSPNGRAMYVCGYG